MDFKKQIAILKTLKRRKFPLGLRFLTHDLSVTMDYISAKRAAYLWIKKNKWVRFTPKLSPNKVSAELHVDVVQSIPKNIRSEISYSPFKRISKIQVDTYQNGLGERFIIGIIFHFNRKKTVHLWIDPPGDSREMFFAQKRSISRLSKNAPTVEMVGKLKKWYE